MSVIRRESVPIRSDHDVVLARQLVRKCSQALGFSLVDQTKVVTAASELSRNTLIHGGGGVMHLQVLNDGPRCGLELRFEDQGPGIPDIELALREGYSTGTGLGLGLPGAKRLVNEFEIASRPGEGTVVTVRKWK